MENLKYEPWYSGIVCRVDQREFTKKRNRINSVIIIFLVISIIILLLAIGGYINEPLFSLLGTILGSLAIIICGGIFFYNNNEYKKNIINDQYTEYIDDIEQLKIIKAQIRVMNESIVLQNKTIQRIKPSSFKKLDENQTIKLKRENENLSTLEKQKNEMINKFRSLSEANKYYHEIESMNNEYLYKIISSGKDFNNLNNFEKKSDSDKNEDFKKLFGDDKDKIKKEFNKKESIINEKVSDYLNDKEKEAITVFNGLKYIIENIGVIKIIEILNNEKVKNSIKKNHEAVYKRMESIIDEETKENEKMKTEIANLENQFNDTKESFKIESSTLYIYPESLIKEIKINESNESNEFDSIKSQRNDLQNKIRLLKEEIEKYISTNFTINNINMELSNYFDLLDNKVKELNDSIKNKPYTEWKVESDKLVNKINELQVEIKQKNKEIEEIKQKNKEIDSAQNTWMSKFSILIGRLQTLDTTITDADTENKTRILKKDINRFPKFNSDVQQLKDEVSKYTIQSFYNIKNYKEIQNIEKIYENLENNYIKLNAEFNKFWK